MAINLSRITEFFRVLEKQVNSGELKGVLTLQEAQAAYTQLQKQNPDLIPQEIKQKFRNGLTSDIFNTIDPLGIQDNLINDQELFASLGIDPTFKPWTPDRDTSETAIDGSKGPFNLNDPTSGNYGRNAAINVQKTPLESLASSDIRYTPSEKPMRADAVGYAEQDIKHFDTDGSGTLNQKEVRAAFGGGADTQIPDTLFKAINTDSNDSINNLEQAAYVMFQDNSVSALYSAIDANENAGQMTAQKANDLRAKIGQLATKTSKADGLITVEERTFADQILLLAPDLGRQVLEGFQDFISKA